MLTTEQIPQTITAWVVDMGLQPWQFLLVVNIVLLVAGAFMEPSAIILILAPILFPIAVQLGIDPIHLGIIMVVNMEIGLITTASGAKSVRHLGSDRYAADRRGQSRLAMADAAAQLPDCDHLRAFNLSGTAELAGHDLTATPCVLPYTLLARPQCRAFFLLAVFCQADWRHAPWPGSRRAA